MPMPAYRGVFQDSNNRETEIISKSTYRVSVCLKRYFNDMRALCYVLISRKKTVKWLEKKIKKLFNVNGDFILTCRGHLLPSSERLGLLNADDIVEVVPNEIASQLKNKIKCVHAVTNNGSNVENISISFDENDSAADKNQIYSSTITFGQKDTLKELELEQRLIQNNQYQNEIDCIGASSNSTAADVVEVESEYKTIEKCDSGASAKKKYSFEQKDRSKVELDKSVENDISNNSNINYLSTDEVQDELEVMKKNALALLDSSFSICSNRSQNGSNIGGTRKRKRVRRKRQQVLIPEEMSENSIENDHVKDILPRENEINNVTESSKTIPLAVLHNEELSIRKPRIVKSIEEST